MMSETTPNATDLRVSAVGCTWSELLCRRCGRWPHRYVPCEAVEPTRLHDWCCPCCPGHPVPGPREYTVLYREPWMQGTRSEGLIRAACRPCGTVWWCRYQSGPEGRDNVWWLEP